MKRTRPVYQLGRKARFALGSRMGARYVATLGGRAHYNDFMLTSTAHDHVESYRRGAVAFVDTLGRALTAAGRRWADIDACLEIGCGYGRIVRELRSKLPPETIAVCDLIDEGARFTAAEFGVKRVPTVEVMGADHDGHYNLVYLLSVYTHLNRADIEANLRRVARLLKSGGILVFTTHGDRSAGSAARYGQYWLDEEKLQAALERDGFFYERYPYYYAEYGLTWILPAEMERIVATTAPALSLVLHEPAAVDGHQDIFVYRRS